MPKHDASPADPSSPMGQLLDRLSAVQPAVAESEPEVFYLWPDCEQAWHVFWQLGGQWHCGMGGKVGLCLADVRTHLDELGIAHGPERKELWDLLLAAQDGALQAWAHLRELDQ